MGLRIKLLALVVGILFFFIVLGFIRRNSLKASFAVLWILISLFLMSIPLAEKFYTWITYTVIGIVDARHTIYIGLIGFLLVYIFYLTIKLSKMDDRIQELISYTAILGSEESSDIKSEDAEKERDVDEAV